MLSSGIENALRILVKNGNGIDIASLLKDGLKGSELGDAFTGMLEAGYLSGLESIDLELLDAQLALITGHVGDSLGTGMDGAAVAGTWVSGLTDGMEGGAEAVASAAGTVGAAGKNGAVSGGMNYSSGKSMAKNMADGMVYELARQKSRVGRASGEFAQAALTAATDKLEIRSPSRRFRWMAHMSADGYVQGLTERMNMVRSTMRRVVDTSGLSDTLPIHGKRDEGAQFSGHGGSSVNYNITIPNAQIRSETDARELLRAAAKYTNSLNRGWGR